jgi:TRAP-type C4-dicarboxylate transport system substrate-binding protein
MALTPEQQSALNAALDVADNLRRVIRTKREELASLRRTSSTIEIETSDLVQQYREVRKSILEQSAQLIPQPEDI